MRAAKTVLGVVAAVAVSAVAVVAGACSRAEDGTEAPRVRPSGIGGPFSPSSSPPAPSLAPGVLVKTTERFHFRVAFDPNHVVWVTGPLQARIAPTVLMQRDLRSKRSTTLAVDVDPGFGLASTTGWVAYADTGSESRLLAVTHDGRRRVTLSSSLVAPIAGRGELVAWAEQVGHAHRVVVRDMARNTDWVAAEMPRCVRGRCYQIGGVTLAERGVVFTRSTTAPDTSVVVRRAFSDSRPQEVRIPGDPQPELAPSSAGALYYVFRRGWLRWDFGDARPRPTRFGADPPVGVLAYERDRWFIVTQKGCSAGIVALRSGPGRQTVADPKHVHAAAGGTHGGCAQLGGFAFTGRQLLTAWGVIPERALEEHSDHGLAGVVLAGKPVS